MNAPRFLRRLLGLALVACAMAAAAEPKKAKDSAEAKEADAEAEEVATMAAYTVQADRVEDFGFRMRGMIHLIGSTYPHVVAVYPHTAAARAGLRPGDRILKMDGKSAAASLFTLTKWGNIRKRKLAEINAGKPVTWVLELEDPETKAVRTATLVVPTTAPRWGAKKWTPPAGRAPATVNEPGPLDAHSRTILEQGVSSLLSPYTASAFGIEKDHAKLVRGYEWIVVSGATTHRMFVTQERGRTDVLFESFAKDARFSFLTSPAGDLREAARRARMLRGKDGSLDEARPYFEAECDFWLKQVGKFSERWPLELDPAAKIPEAAIAGPGGAPTAVTKLHASFATLPVATEVQRTLFAEAIGKIGADAESWAYTETVKALDNQRVYTVRVDPSKPESERCTLLKLDGKAPKPADIQRWRDEGRDGSAPLGEIPSLAGVVDTSDVRVLREDAVTVVFELPVRTSGQFSSENFQALFRVNKAWRGFEEIAVKLRAPFALATGIKVVDGGFSVRFQSLSPQIAPQPVALQAGGAARVLLVKLSRNFEATRSEFTKIFSVPQILLP